MQTADPNDDFKAHDIKTMGKDRDAEAKELLTRAAAQVQPIMRSRKWKVKKLSEFFPKNDCLLGLNVNRGAEVKIRLRPAGREKDFFPYEAIVGTLLHELTHIKVSPHNQDFYKLLDQITEECESLMARGVTGTGQGFDAPSAGRLGGRAWEHNPPEEKMKQIQLEASLKRAHLDSVMPSGGRKLGGDKRSVRTLSPAQAAARAAERRMMDNIWCGAGQEDSQVGPSTTSPASRCTPSTSSDTTPHTSSSTWKPNPSISHKTNIVNGSRHPLSSKTPNPTTILSTEHASNSSGVLRAQRKMRSAAPPVQVRASKSLPVEVNLLTPPRLRSPSRPPLPPPPFLSNIESHPNRMITSSALRPQFACACCAAAQPSKTSRQDCECEDLKATTNIRERKRAKGKQVCEVINLVEDDVDEKLGPDVEEIVARGDGRYRLKKDGNSENSELEEAEMRRGVLGLVPTAP
eukprot:CAMPEP_0196573552 /NCGR_PEP_ID=MMETSP1081-20130531/3438_1 /TAXON_ID=36882 /ORGANISM="Pyramimonas amylifera, Strain CCMP720" /LENGTH=461 /DNA_ID=CAMNT_0041891299 /DNA_START=29 /DNA_END=1418 /DNA_ORIENTATION=-